MNDPGSDGAADWRESVVNAVDLQLGPSRGADGASWTPIGSVTPKEEPNWYTIRGGLKFKPSPSARLCFGDDKFSGDDDPSATVYAVNGFYEDPNGYHFEASRRIPTTHRQIWYRKEPPGAVLRSITEVLAGRSDSPLADDLAKGIVQPIPELSSKIEGLTQDQSAAYECCLAPGVRFVWGPPGAGKTRVLTEALDTLIRNGKRTLLVSVANVAVDNAVVKLVSAGGRDEGCVVRAGQAQLPELRRRADVILPALARSQTKSAEAAVAELQSELAELPEFDAVALSTVREVLRDFDHDKVVAAREAVARELDRRRLVQEELTQKTLLRQAQIDLENARRAHDEVCHELSAAEGARRHLVAAANSHATASVKSVELETCRRQQEQHEQAREQLKGWLSTLTLGRRLLRGQRELQAREVLLEAEIYQCHKSAADFAALALPYTAGQLGALDRRAAEVTVILEQAQRTEGEVDKKYSATMSELRSQDQHPLPTGQQRSLVARAADCDYDRKRTEFQQLEMEQKRAVEARRSIEQKLADALKDLERLRRNAEGEILKRAQVVATTLTYARMRSDIKRDQFDVVLIDEVGMAPMAEVLAALALGKETAVLFGDFLQLMPIFNVSRRVKKAGEAEATEVERWLGESSFQYVGIESPSDAIRHHGCVALVHQFRFGSKLRQFANELVYEVLKDGDTLSGIPSNPQTDIVVVNVGDLGGLEAVVRPGNGVKGWTIGGMLLSRALAKAHLDRRETVGIVAPYGYQADATRAALRDESETGDVPVGTAHSFQGTEYDAVVFDLVEDGRGWMAKACRGRPGEWGDSGLRLAAVASTRARQRLYLLVDLEATKSLASNPEARVMHAIHGNVESGFFEEWSAAELLDLAPRKAKAGSSIFGAVHDELSKSVNVEHVYDERTFHSALENELKVAKHSIWMWAPWVASRFREVEPHLRAAISRGVAVTVFVRTEETHGQPSSQKYVDAALSLDANIVRSHYEHRKVVVIDREVTIMGSLNPLSGRAGSREVMVLYRGAGYAERILNELKAQEHSKPPQCPKCGGSTYLWRSSGKKDPGYYWRCEQCKEKRLCQASE